MGVKAMSHMLSTHLYYRRSFPFYTFNILGGLDDEGAVTAVLLRTATSPFRVVGLVCDHFFAETTAAAPFTTACRDQCTSLVDNDDNVMFV